jgi:hypothetical protein
VTEEEEVEGSRDRGGVVTTGGQGEILTSPPTNLLQIQLRRWGEGRGTVHLLISPVGPPRTEDQPVSATPQCHRHHLLPPCLHPPPPVHVCSVVKLLEYCKLVTSLFTAAVPQMYMPPSASLPPPPSQMMPPPPSQHTQQVTIPNEVRQPCPIGHHISYPALLCSMPCLYWE